MIRTRFAVTHLAAAMMAMMAMMALPASAAGLPTPAAAPDAAPTAASDPAPGTDSATGSATDSAGNPTSSPRLAREAFTTGAGVTDPGVLVLNLGAQAGFDRDGAKSRRMPTQLALGLTSWLDARVAWSGPTRLQDAVGGSRSGGGDPLFGGQAQALHQDQAGLDLGLAYWHKLPRASVQKGIGSGKADDTLLATGTRTAGAWEFDANAGANWLGRQDGPGRIRQGVATLAVTRTLGPGWNLSLDTSALAATELGARSVTSLLALSRDLTPDLTVDLGAEAGLTRSAERMAIDAGLVWRVCRFWGQDR